MTAKQDTTARLARRLGLAAGWAGLALVSAVVLFDTVWPQGAEFVKYGLGRRFETLHHLVVVWWMPFCVGLCAAAVALLADSRGLPRRGRAVLLGIAAAGVLGSLYGLRFVAHADDRLRDVYFAAWDVQAWLAWTGAVVWVALPASVVVGVAAVLARRSPPTERPPAATDMPAARVAFWASTAALATILVQAVRSRVWSSATVDAMVAHGFGGQRWPATAAVLLAEICWPLAGLAAVIMVGRRSRAVWALLGGAGVCGLLMYGSAAVVTLRSWAEAPLDAPVGAGYPGDVSLWSDSVWTSLESSREALLASLVVYGLLVVLAAVLVMVALRHYAAWRRRRTAPAPGTSPLEASAASPRRRQWPIVAAVLAVSLAVLAPLFADVLVTDGGALLGTGGNQSPSAASAAAEPTATSPTPIPNGDESPSPESPRITGTVPGNRSGGGEVRSWNVNRVQVNVDPNGVGLDLAVSELTINGERVTGQPTTPELTPVTKTVVWSLDKKYYGKGSCDFVVTLVATDGRRFSFGWSYSRP